MLESGVEASPDACCAGRLFSCPDPGADSLSAAFLEVTHARKWSAGHRVQGTLYHAPVPQPSGDLILPLNQMRSRYPELDEQKYAKYRGGREYVPTLPFPPLNCTWGDVLFFSPVDSRSLFAAIRQSGRSAPDGQLDHRRWRPGPGPDLHPPDAQVSNRPEAEPAPAHAGRVQPCLPRRRRRSGDGRCRSGLSLLSLLSSNRS